MGNLIWIFLIFSLGYLTFKIKVDKDKIETDFYLMLEEKEELERKNSKNKQEIWKLNRDIEELYKVLESTPEILTEDINSIKTRMKNSTI